MELSIWIGSSHTGIKKWLATTGLCSTVRIFATNFSNSCSNYLIKWKMHILATSLVTRVCQGVAEWWLMEYVGAVIYLCNQEVVLKKCPSSTWTRSGCIRTYFPIHISIILSWLSTWFQVEEAMYLNPCFSSSVWASGTDGGNKSWE